MKPEDQIKALAELDGWKLSDVNDRFGNLFWTKFVDGKEMWRRVGEVPKAYMPLPSYLTSYDAIIPLVEKQPRAIRASIFIRCGGDGIETPSQLAEALLLATGKWIEK